ncbi:Snd2p Ecym_1519 [Eremothecium cymbalariae DBVPG|uniref:Uncharacterized protein n=1 Tax=Eremothecium cymbalariae (strain CBS 270.75 / DBVPG 7215 / KCTC 17166 / NRRL Y-17582) TaxID=931890 RepID=G8JMS6_ERECY|nr:hypothetical protein Ecym_1519 [Eremothecium cymbalariae DBVPG\
MAGKSDKKQAAANLSNLKTLYTLSIPIIILSGIRSLVFSRDSLFYYALLHGPLFVCMYVVERSGRPQYDERGRVKKAGIDLNQSGGLTGAIFDVIYSSLFCDVVKLVFNSNWAWCVMVWLPFYWGYQLYLLRKSMFFGAGGGGGARRQ